MRLVTDSGLWSTETTTATTPLVAVLELSGAVLSWTVDEPPTAPHIAFTDPSRADWLWRVLGESGHLAVTSALTQHSADGSYVIDLTGVDIVPGSMDPLRKLALGHWLRRWWPASRRDGITGLDRALLDVEVALLTVDAQGFFTDDTLDSGIAELLAPHSAALLAHLREDDPRVCDLVRAGAAVADEVGIEGAGWSKLAAAIDDSSFRVETPSGRRRDDYALAAGSDAVPETATLISRGVTSMNWGAVPPGIFDAAENTVEWRIETTGATVVAVVRTAVIGPDPPTGVVVRVQSGAVSGTGALTADGRATVPLVDAQRRAMTESAGWDHDWLDASVIVGADVAESAPARERVRRWARTRSEHPPGDAYLAEILAAESSY